MRPDKKVLLKKTLLEDSSLPGTAKGESWLGVSVSTTPIPGNPENNDSNAGTRDLNTPDIKIPLGQVYLEKSCLPTRVSKTCFCLLVQRNSKVFFNRLNDENKTRVFENRPFIQFCVKLSSPQSKAGKQT